MATTWTLGVLPPLVENVIELDRGSGACPCEAHAAAMRALVDAAAERGRQEFRLTVGDREIIILPGLTDDGQVDFAGLQDDPWLAPRWP